jgi:hypothetical protein
LTWIVMCLQRDGYWREFNGRRHGSNPPPSGRKPAPPPEQPLAAVLIRYQRWRDEQVRQALTDPRLGEPWLDDCQPDRQADVVLDREASEAELVRRRRDRELYGWGPRQLPPPTPAPGLRREYLWGPTQMAECGGPCWEARGPRSCTCGALWRDVPIRLDEGQVQRGGFGDGPTTPKPPFKPQPTGGP